MKPITPYAQLGNEILWVFAGDTTLDSATVKYAVSVNTQNHSISERDHASRFITFSPWQLLSEKQKQDVLLITPENILASIQKNLEPLPTNIFDSINKTC